MANELISALAAISSVAGSEEFPCNNGGVDNKVTSAQLATYFQALSLTLATIKYGYYTAVKVYALANTAGLTWAPDFNESNVMELSFGGTTTTVTTVSPANPKIGTIMVKVKHGASGANTILFPTTNWLHIGVEGEGAKTYSFAGSATQRYTFLNIHYDGSKYYVSYAPFTTSLPTIS